MVLAEDFRPIPELVRGYLRVLEREIEMDVPQFPVVIRMSEALQSVFLVPLYTNHLVDAYASDFGRQDPCSIWRIVCFRASRRSRRACCALRDLKKHG